MTEILKLSDFSQWTEATRGIYRYVVAAGCCYEILILDHTHKTDIMDAKALLFIAGYWFEHSTGRDFFGREQLKEGTVRECVEASAKDYTEEMTED